MAEIRRGVNARDTSDRSLVWSGGSMLIIWWLRSSSGPRLSSTVEWAELNVDGFLLAASTSSNRLMAQKSRRSLRYTGASSRNRFHTGYGSSSMSTS